MDEEKASALERLTKEQELIEGYINNFVAAETAKPITDGVVDVEKYLNSKPRICWVLKEAYCESGKGGGGWSLTGELLSGEHVYDEFIRGSPSRQTWEPVVYTTYALLHDFVAYGDMTRISDAPEMAQCLNNIALVNVGKMPGDTRSNDADIAAKYEFWKPILHWQLKQYDPQIVIFGNTFQYFQRDLGISDDERKQTGRETICVVKNKKIYVWAYHPAQTIITRDDYVQQIINGVKENSGFLSEEGVL
jgi:hypothetical protein